MALRKTLVLFRAHWRHLLAVSFSVHAGLGLVGVLLILLLDSAGVAFATLLLYTGTYWTQGAVARAVEDVRDGRADLTIRETLRTLGPRLNRLSFASILVTIGVGVGLGVLVLPGLFLLVRWSMVAQVIVLEGTGTLGSLRRSWALVRGESFRVLWLIVVSALVLLAGFIGAAILAGFASLVGTWGVLVWIVVLFVAMTPAVAFVAVLWSVLYFELRSRREPAAV